jgi:hypothetical protein
MDRAPLVSVRAAMAFPTVSTEVVASVPPEDVRVASGTNRARGETIIGGPVHGNTAHTRLKRRAMLGGLQELRHEEHGAEQTGEPEKPAACEDQTDEIEAWSPPEALAQPRGGQWVSAKPMGTLSRPRSSRRCRPTGRWPWPDARRFGAAISCAVTFPLLGCD